MLTENCKCLKLLDLSDSDTHFAQPKGERRSALKYKSYLQVSTTQPKPRRRYWLVNEDVPLGNMTVQPRTYEDEKDANIKHKIATLVQQTMHDAEKKMTLIQELKDEYREEAPYRAGFILSMVKKSKDILDELFNVAVKHRDEWMALEQLKIFELIVHTNVDTTNLLRQLVDVHVKHLNATQSDKKRVILL